MPNADEAQHLQEKSGLSVRGGGARRCSIVRTEPEDLPVRSVSLDPFDQSNQGQTDAAHRLGHLGVVPSSMQLLRPLSA